MKKIIFLYACIATLTASGQSAPFSGMFCPVDTAWSGKTIVVPPAPLRYNILLKEADVAHNLTLKNSAGVKGGFGAVYYDEQSRGSVTTIGAMKMTASVSGWLYLSLRDNKAGITGDGGGVLRMKVKSNASGDWQIDPQTEAGTTYNYRFFDMDTLGGSTNNNGIHLGAATLGAAAGNIFMYDGYALSNTELSPGITDLSNYILPAGSPQPGLSIPRYQNMGWLIELNALNGKPLRKLYDAGRGHFGGMLASSTVISGTSAATGITVIYTTQTQPAVLLKYEYPDNRISAFKQTPGSDAGQWLLLNEMDVDGSLFPFSFTELLDVQKLALEKGATMFNRLGGIAAGNIGEFYIAETGGNSASGAFTAPATAYAGVLARHLELRDADHDGRFSDPYGRILKFTPTATGIEVKPYLEGGRTLDKRYVFSNPKQLISTRFNYNPLSTTTSGVAQYLVINEEVPDNSFNRNPPAAATPEELMQEVYFLDIKETAPDLGDLRPFAIIPRGAEVQSAFSERSRWSPLFLSIRYPNPGNDAPYQQSLLLAISNFESYFSGASAACSWSATPSGTDTTTTAINEVSYTEDDAFQVWPNPARRVLYFNQAADVQLFDINGRLLKDRKQATELEILDLVPGMYFIRSGQGKGHKIIIR